MSVPAQAMVWRRLDGPGGDSCRLNSTPDGWCLDGMAEFLLEQQQAKIHYLVRCGPGFQTIDARVHGLLGEREVSVVIEKRDDGWWLNGSLVPGLEACVDVDLGFTPATNWLPIVRLALADGERKSAPAAWLDVARGSLEPLPQWYERRAERKYWYEAPSANYAAWLTVNAAGFVVDYPGLWRAAASVELCVRRLNLQEIALHRELRLAALRDSPDQLGEALADAEAGSDADWAARTASIAPPSVHAAYIAELDGAAIGMAYALTDRSDSSIGRLGGMWVLPSARGAGVGQALVDAVLGWGRAAGKRCVQLWVVPGGAPERLYRRAGFVPTGASKGFPGALSRSVIELQLDLEPGV